MIGGLLVSPHPYWPLFDLRICTPRLEIRAPTDDDIAALVRVVDEQGVHDPGTMPFLVPWTDGPARRRRLESAQFFWRCRAEWSPARWHFSGVVSVQGTVVGVQDLMATDFATLCTVSTGSWLGRAYQGQGLGKEMRAAVLHLAFAGLGAREAHSGAFADNLASLAVSRSLGYEENGTEVASRRGGRATLQRLCLTRERWEAGRRDDIAVAGLDRCLELFGARTATA